MYTIGIDIGSSYIKCALVDYAGNIKVIDRSKEKIRKRNPFDLAFDMTEKLLMNNQVNNKDISYTAATGESEVFKHKTGHFFSITSFGYGGHYIYPETRFILDLGAYYIKIIRIDEKGKVLDYRMTGQCASGSGQFVENISKYLGLSVSELGDISLRSKNPEMPSGICAVLAETDVINMLSRGLKIEDIIKGIHLSVAQRIAYLISPFKIDGPLLLTGGMALNKGIVNSLKETLAKGNNDIKIVSHPDSVYTGAIGAGLLGGYRHSKMKK